MPNYYTGISEFVQSRTFMLHLHVLRGLLYRQLANRKKGRARGKEVADTRQYDRSLKSKWHIPRMSLSLFTFCVCTLVNTIHVQWKKQ